MLNSNKNHIIKIATFLVLIVLVSTDLHAQIGLPGGGDVDDVPEAPINAFIAIALAVGSYFGIKKLRK